MSKSLKNTVSIKEFLESYSADDFRMLCLLSNYRTGKTSELFDAIATLRMVLPLFIYRRNGLLGKIPRNGQ